MKILLVNNTFGNFGGGSEQATYLTGELLKQKGHQVYYFSSDRKPYYKKDYKFQGFFPENLNLSDISAFKKIKLLPRVLYNPQARENLDSLIQEIKPDLIHINCIQYNLTSSVLFACKKHNIPTVMTLHDSCFACPALTLMRNNIYCNSKSCIKGNVLPCIANRCFSGSITKSIIASAEFLFKRHNGFLNIPDYFVCPSKFTFNLALDAGIPEEKLALIHNFINYSNYNQNISNKGYFLYVGRLVKEKGLHSLVNAFKDLPDIELRLVGEGIYENELRAFIKANNLTNIKLMGFKKSQELENEYKGCLATILPTIGSEIFGLTILESFSYGKPVIASRIGGIPEAVNNDINGIIFDPGNVNELKAAVLRLWDNPKLTDKLGANGKMKFKDLYSKEVHYEKLINVYEKCLI